MTKKNIVNQENNETVFSVQTCFSSEFKEFSLADRDGLLDFIIKNTKENSPVKVFIKDSNQNKISK